MSDMSYALKYLIHESLFFVQPLNYGVAACHMNSSFI